MCRGPSLSVALELCSSLGIMTNQGLVILKAYQIALKFYVLSSIFDVTVEDDSRKAVLGL